MSDAAPGKATASYAPQPPAGLPAGLRSVLSNMMFLQYFVWGVWVVSFATFLGNLPTDGGLAFPGGYIGIIYGTSAIGAMISPLFIGLFADRLFSTEKVLAVLHVAGAGLLAWGAWHCQEQVPTVKKAFENSVRIVRDADPEKFDVIENLAYSKQLGERIKKETDAAKKKSLESESEALQKKLKDPLKKVNEEQGMAAAVTSAHTTLFWIMLGYALCYMPTLTLTNSLSFRNLSDPDRWFGQIRVLGTIGWIAAGLVAGFALDATSPQPIFVAAGASALLGISCLALPHTPPSGGAKSLGDSLGLPALGMLKEPSFLIFVVCSFLISIVLSFYYAFGNQFITAIEAPNPTALQTIGQGSEIFFMLLIPFGLRLFGTKGMLVIGMGAWVVRYGVFSTMNVPLVIAIGLPIHGICYDFFFVVSYLYVDRKAPKELRASAQGLITFVTLGVGMFIGNIVGGYATEYYKTGTTIDWASFWLVPLAGSAIATVLFALLFRDNSQSEPAKPA